MSKRRENLENTFDLFASYLSGRLKNPEEPLHHGELSVILKFLESQGINCDGEKNPEVQSMSESLSDFPVNNVTPMRNK